MNRTMKIRRQTVCTFTGSRSKRKMGKRAMRKTYEEFKNYVVENIKEYLPAEYYDAVAEIQKQTKNNGAVMDGLQIDNGMAVRPVIYLEGAYDAYKRGAQMSYVMENLAFSYLNAVNQAPAFDIASLENFDAIKGQIRARLINQLQNVELLSTVPYQRFEDLAVTYHVMVSEDRFGSASIKVTNEMMEHWGVDRDTLHETAMANTLSSDTMTITSLREMLTGMIQRRIMVQDDVDEIEAEQITQALLAAEDMMPVYIVTNQSGSFGAVGILSDDIRERLSEMLGGDYYVLPSSVHEVLVLPADAGMSPEELSDRVQSVNNDAVDEKDRLSDYVYFYNAREKNLSLAECRAVQRNPEEMIEKIVEKEQSIRR